MKKILLMIMIITALTGCVETSSDSLIVENTHVQAPVETPEPDSVKTGTPVILSDLDLKDMNIFFSNFSEAFFREYTEKTTDEDIIQFAMTHNRINYNDRWKYENEYEVISASHISNTITRFFDREIKLRDIYNYKFENDKFYVPMATGEQYLGFMQVDSIMKNDEILTVKLIDFQYDNSDGLHGDFDKKAYEPMKNWSDDLRGRCEKSGTVTATVKTANIDGKNTYQLLSLKED